VKYPLAMLALASELKERVVRTDSGV